jgi:hypothetical protein
MSRPQPGQEERMNSTIESEKNAAAADVSPKAKHVATKKAKPSKKAVRAKRPPSRPTADRADKKAEVIALMKRARGVTLAEIMKAKGWQKHTVRGFDSILGSKGGEKIESSKSDAGDRTFRIAK